MCAKREHDRDVIINKRLGFYDVKNNQRYIFFMVLGKMPPRKMPPRKIALQKIAPTLLKKYFVKLLHVMEYLSGENFVNFEFRQS